MTSELGPLVLTLCGIALLAQPLLYVILSYQNRKPRVLSLKLTAPTARSAPPVDPLRRAPRREASSGVRQYAPENGSEKSVRDNSHSTGPGGAKAIQPPGAVRPGDDARAPESFLAGQNSTKSLTPSGGHRTSGYLPASGAPRLGHPLEAKPTLLEFFRLKEQPFGVTPDPAYLYLSRTHRAALDSLLHGLQSDRGFMALIARPGMGKTTLLYQLLEHLRDSARTVFLFQTQCESREFFRHLLSELGCDASGMDLVAMHNHLNQLLFQEMLNGKRFVVVVDEAQNLTEPVLEMIRLLSDFETPHAKLLEIILAGQPELAIKLSRPRLVQLRQRIAILNRLEPFSATETLNYISHRLHVAGHGGGMLFDLDALALIAERSHGIPRQINNLCFNAMSLAYEQGRRTVTPEIVRAVDAALNMDALAWQEPANPPPAAAPRPMGPMVMAQAAPGPVPPRGLGPWSYAAALCAGVLLAGFLLFPTVRRLMREARNPSVHADVPAAAAIEAWQDAGSALERDPSTLDPENSPAVSDSATQKLGTLQVLIVVPGPRQTVRDVSLHYLGRFNASLFKDIRQLNPGIYDAEQVVAGQPIRLPLQPGSLRKGFDSAKVNALPAKIPNN